MADTKLTPEQLQVQATALKEVAYEKLAKAEEGIERAKKFAASQGRLTKVSAALEKAQAAQAQFNETKAKFEAYKAKAEAAAKKKADVHRMAEANRAYSHYAW